MSKEQATAVVEPPTDKPNGNKVLLPPVSMEDVTKAEKAIQKAELELWSAEAKLSSAKEAVKAAEGTVAAKIATLRNLINDKKPNLFNQPQGGKNEPWRTALLRTVNVECGELLTDKDFEILDDKGLKTLGEFVDFQAKHGEFWGKELKGFGPQRQEKLCNLLETFWKQHPEYTR